jgi:hypothetical protein
VYIAKGVGLNPGDPVAFQNEVEVTVPGGSYLIEGTGTVYNADGDSQVATCELNTNRQADLSPIEGGHYVSFAIQDARFFPGQTTIKLTCSGFKAQGYGLALTATKVGAINP